MKNVFRFREALTWGSGCTCQYLGLSSIRTGARRFRGRNWNRPACQGLFRTRFPSFRLADFWRDV